MKCGQKLSIGEIELSLHFTEIGALLFILGLKVGQIVFQSLFLRQQIAD
jgi:uncharacterized membrane protein YciS (DUF1049 family)